MIALFEWLYTPGPWMGPLIAPIKAQHFALVSKIDISCGNANKTSPKFGDILYNQ